MLSWTLYRGFDGQRAFALPLSYSTIDSRVRQLDDISMETYVRAKGWNSPRLDWMINYACRDDYGGTMATVSAWAGIHYFACRYYDQRLRNEYPSDTLTWPAGNGFLVQRLAQDLADSQYRLQSAALRIDNDDGSVRVGYFDILSETYRSILAQTVIHASKLHTAPFLVDGLPDPQVAAIKSCVYSPWLTASIHVSALPTNAEVSIAWDNVLYDSRSLGYVVADHQTRSDYREQPIGPSLLSPVRREHRSGSSEAPGRRTPLLGQRDHAGLVGGPSRSGACRQPHRRLSVGSRHDPTEPGSHMGTRKLSFGGSPSETCISPLVTRRDCRCSKKLVFPAFGLPNRSWSASAEHSNHQSRVYPERRHQFNELQQGT